MSDVTPEDNDTDWEALEEAHPLLKWMRAGGVPLTRENFIDAKWGADRPEP
jgi:hypothetical protein